MTRRSTKRNADTGLLRRLPKRNTTANARWMHCGAGEISVLYTLHALIGDSMQQYVIYSTLLGILLAITSTAGVNANLTAINAGGLHHNGKNDIYSHTETSGARRGAFF
jgi:hypothetical protein